MNGHGDRHRRIAESDWRLAVLLIVLLAAIYTFTYSGTFITDDEHILASRTLALAFDGELNDLRVYGNSRVFFLSQLNPGYAEQGTGIEPAQAALGSMLARFADALDLGRVQAIFMLNIWVTALTAAAIYVAVRIEGYSRRTGLMISLLFGLASIAWPYSQTYFRDPLAMLFVSIAWAAALAISAKCCRHKHFAWLLFFGALIGGVLSKNTVLIALPVLLLMIVIRKWRTERERGLILILREHRFTIILIGAAILLLIAVSLALPRQSAFARFTFSYYRSLLGFFYETPHANLLAAIAGPFVSPGKSIFITTPILLLALIALFKHWRVAWPAWLYLILLVLVQGLFYDSGWWGSINWGLRFSLPAIPPLMLTLAPIVEKWWDSNCGKIAIGVLTAVSVFVQLAGLLPPMRKYYLELYRSSVSEFQSIWAFKHSAFIWHLNWLFSGGTWDLAAIRVGHSALPVIISLGLTIALAIMGIIKMKWRRLPYLLLVACLGLNVCMLYACKHDPAYNSARGDLDDAVEVVSDNGASGDLMLLKSYGTPAWLVAMNRLPGTVRWASLPFAYPSFEDLAMREQTGNPEFALDEMTLHLFKNDLGSYDRVWLLLPDDAPGADLGLELEWLESCSSSSEAWQFTSDGRSSKLFLFALDPSLLP